MIELLYYLRFLEPLHPLADLLGLWGAIVVLWCVVGGGLGAVLRYRTRFSNSTLRFAQVTTLGIAMSLAIYGAWWHLQQNQAYVELLELDGASAEQVALFRDQGTHEARKTCVVGALSASLLGCLFWRMQHVDRRVP